MSRAIVIRCSAHKQAILMEGYYLIDHQRSCITRLQDIFGMSILAVVIPPMTSASCMQAVQLFLSQAQSYEAA